MSQDVGKLKCQIAQVPLYLIHHVQPPSKEIYVIVEKQGLNFCLFVDAQDMGKIYFCIVYLLYEYEKKTAQCLDIFFFFYVTIQCPCLIHKNHMQFSLSVVSVKTDGKKEVYVWSLPSLE